jgi:hypothetical protein
MRKLTSLVDKRQLCCCLVLGIPKCSAREAIRTWTENQHHSAWRDLPGLRHRRLFIGRPCKKRADDLLKLSRHQLKMVVAILTGHAAVRGHLYIMGLFEGDPTCRLCRKETETVQHIICCCKALAHQNYNVFGNLFVETKGISTASVRDLCLFIRGLRLRCIWGKMLTDPKEEEEDQFPLRNKLEE